MKLLLAAASLGALAGTCVANDPSGGWLSYVTYTDPQDRRITALNTTWNVPSKPESLMGSNAPGWWFGIQTKDGDGALIQPILAWGYEGDRYTIFDACFDWTDGSWHTSEDSYTVQPGDTVSSSITYREEDNSYDMYIVSHQTGKSVSMNYQIQDAQHKNESQAYFVLEHQPNRCSAYPSSGLCTFENIYLEVDGEEVSDVAWEAKQENPMCDSKATVVDSKTLKFEWDAKADIADDAKAVLDEPQKWTDATVNENDVPELAPVWTADIVAKTSGTFPGVPHETQTYTEYHDFTNDRRRVDYTDQGFTKIYRYDVQDWDHQPFPAPKGYKMRLDSSGTPDPLSCCWLWLVDSDTGENDKMLPLTIPTKSTDEGATTINGVPVELWQANTLIPIKTTNDFYIGNNSVPVQVNTFSNVLGKGTVIANTTYTNFVAGPIPNSTFDVPDSKPTFGKCKQCGVDPECPMQQCIS
mmetsp:Transcript_37086/g.54502  ORF Transcript_37086/g.54502 Transcript_37086/m.54502 type:complete len:469 (+) Transcript_37086:62-1468(+)